MSDDEPPWIRAVAHHRLVALVLVVGSVLADELLGTIIKVDADAKVLIVVQKDTDKEIKVKVTDKTEQVTKKGTRKLDLEKLEKCLEKAQGRREEGIQAKITHEKGVASKIEYDEEEGGGQLSRRSAQSAASLADARSTRSTRSDYSPIEPRYAGDTTRFCCCSSIAARASSDDLARSRARDPVPSKTDHR